VKEKLPTISKSAIIFSKVIQNFSNGKWDEKLREFQGVGKNNKK
jgi:hypothetical protein